MNHGRIDIAASDKALQRRLRTALERQGFIVHVFDNGYPIVAMMDDWPDVYVIDIRLPDINGLEICRWLKSHPESSHIPVILLSDEPYLKILAASAHPDEYIEKPVSLPELIHKVNALLVAR